MAITMVPVTPDFGAEIGDVDLAEPIAAEDLTAIKQAFWDYAVLIFPKQHLLRKPSIIRSAFHLLHPVGRGE